MIGEIKEKGWGNVPDVGFQFFLSFFFGIACAYFSSLLRLICFVFVRLRFFFVIFRGGEECHSTKDCLSNISYKLSLSLSKALSKQVSQDHIAALLVLVKCIPKDLARLSRIGPQLCHLTESPGSCR